REMLKPAKAGRKRCAPTHRSTRQPPRLPQATRSDHPMRERLSPEVRVRRLVSGAFRTPCRRESPGMLRVCVWLVLLALRGRAGGLVRVCGLAGRVRVDDAGGAAAR